MNSKFTGGLLGLIGIKLLMFFMILFSIGLLTPWAVCIKENWYTKNTYIEGKQLKFIGTGSSLFGQFIIWFLLTIITLGIYGFWLSINMKKWVVRNTVFDS